jgi:hypothetical protein
MGNGAMAKGPQATAPILDSTTTEVSWPKGLVDSEQTFSWVERATEWIAADRPCAESQAGRLSRSAFGSLGRLGKVTANDYRPSSERMSNGNPQGGENVERS